MPLQVTIEGDPHDDCRIAVQAGEATHELLLSVEGDNDTIVLIAPADMPPAVIAAAITAWQAEVMP